MVTMHLVATKNSTSGWKLYKNGLLVATVSQSVIAATAGFAHVGGYIQGGNNRVYPTAESIDAAAAYAAELSAAQVLAHYNAGKS